MGCYYYWDMLRTLIKFFLLLILYFSTFANAQGVWSGGIGYLDQEDYRVNNEVNSLPFGLKFVPVISYRGENLSIYGPNIRYSLLKGAIGSALHLEPSGARYKSKEVELRDTAINAGLSVRIFFLNLKHTVDIYDKYNGSITTATLGHRFVLSESLFLIGSAGYQFLSEAFTDFYYGVKPDEVGTYTLYRPESAQNKIVRINLTYLISKETSLTLNYSFTELDEEVYESPTVGQNSFKTWGIFIASAF